jgi:hypothetical protein
MGKYIRKPVVFNEYSQRDMRILNWAAKQTGNFQNQNFAAFVRDKLEWCMQNENKQFKEAEPDEEQPRSKKGWGKLV